MAKRPSDKKRRWRFAFLPFVMALAFTGAVQAQPESESAREAMAREHFAAGKYQEAVNLYAKLYAETLHPTYLRNIGRCYQNMGEPDRAVASFREYLRKATNLTPEKRAEVEGFIREMEDLKRRRAAEARPAPAPAIRAATPTPVVTAPEQGPVPASLSHAGRLGAFLRVDVGVASDTPRPPLGPVFVPGLSYGLGDRIELTAAALLGRHPGAAVGTRSFTRGSTWKPVAVLAVPIVFADGRLNPGVQAGGGLHWNPHPRFGGFVDLLVTYFPGIGIESELWFVPAIGVQARL